MSIFPTAELDKQLAAFGQANLALVVGLSGHNPWNYHDLVLAVASRETNIVNEVGDGGHGRGAWQIDDRFWLPWLRGQAGVRSGTWGPIVSGVSAATPGYCPDMEAGLAKAISILYSGWEFALNNGVPQASASAVMVAGYNCGPGNALSGYYEGYVDLYTTGGNYSTDVFQRQSGVHAYLVAHGLIT